MRGKKAKRIRREVYGKETAALAKRAARTYVGESIRRIAAGLRHGLPVSKVLSQGSIQADGARQAYQRAKGRRH